MAKKFSGVKPGDRVFYFEQGAKTPAVVLEADEGSATGHALLELQDGRAAKLAWAHYAPGTPGYYGFEGEEAGAEVVEETTEEKPEEKPAENI